MALPLKMVVLESDSYSEGLSQRYLGVGEQQLIDYQLAPVQLDRSLIESQSIPRNQHLISN